MATATITPVGAKNAAEKTPLPPAKRYETGTILTLRQRGHSRTNGEEYFAPAIVLNQYADELGMIETIIFDPTAGTHYSSGYPTRDLGVRGDGNEREQYELRSNVGEVLFSPELFVNMLQEVAWLKRELLALKAQKAPAKA